MKHCLFSLFLSTASPLAAQIVFEPHFIDPCSGKDVTAEVEWFLEDSVQEFGYYDLPFEMPDSVLRAEREGMTNNPISRHNRQMGYAPDPYYVSHGSNLPDSVLSAYQGKRIAFLEPGKYDLFIGIGFPIHLDFKGFNPVRDTFYYYTEEYNYGSDYYGGCGEVADGTLLSLYYDGKIRISATFENGRISDTMRVYYPSGALYEVTTPDGKSFRRIVFHENGLIRSEYDSKKDVEKHYNELGQLTTMRLKNGYFDYRYHGNGKPASTVHSNWKTYTTQQLIYDTAGVLRETIIGMPYPRLGKIPQLRHFEWVIQNNHERLSIQLQTNDFNFFDYRNHRKLFARAFIREVTVFREGKKVTRYKADGAVSSPVYTVYTRRGIRWMKTSTMDIGALQTIIGSAQ